EPERPQPLGAALDVGPIRTGAVAVLPVEGDVRSGLLHLGVAAQMVHVAVGVEHELHVAQPEPKRGKGRRQVAGWRAENAAVDDGRAGAADQVEIDDPAALEGRRQAPGAVVHALERYVSHARWSHFLGDSWPACGSGALEP